MKLITDKILMKYYLDWNVLSCVTVSIMLDTGISHHVYTVNQGEYSSQWVTNSINKNPNQMIQEIMDRYLSVGVQSMQILFVPKLLDCQ
jgi:hypothetical protein